MGINLLPCVASLVAVCFIVAPTFAPLIRLQPYPIADIAVRCGVARPNLMAAMAGRRSLPVHSLPSLYEVLGLDGGGRMRADRVYRWQLRDINDLTGLIAGVQGTGRVWVLRAQSPGLIAERQFFLLSLTSPTGEVYAVIAAPAGMTLGGDSGANPVFQDQPIEVGDPLGWWVDHLPRQAVEQLIAPASRNEVTWEDVLRKAKSLELRPEQVMSMLERQGG